jgi:hypothetical protein
MGSTSKTFLMLWSYNAPGRIYHHISNQLPSAMTPETWRDVFDWDAALRSFPAAAFMCVTFQLRMQPSVDLSLHYELMRQIGEFTGWHDSTFIVVGDRLDMFFPPAAIKQLRMLPETKLGREIRVIGVKPAPGPPRVVTMAGRSENARALALVVGVLILTIAMWNLVI